MLTNEIINLALQRLSETDAPMKSSAELCIHEAKKALSRSQDDSARRWALRSLGYTVGVFHPDYKKASEPRYFHP